MAEHREVAALLAHGGTAAPDGVWDRIVAALDDTPPRMRIEIEGQDGTVVPFERPPAAPGSTAGAAASPWAGRVRVAVLGAAAVVILLLGGLVVRLNDRLDELEGRESLQEVASAAVADPASRRGMFELDDGAVVPAAITADGTGFLLAGSTPPLGDGLVYQLWGLNGDDDDLARHVRRSRRRGALPGRSRHLGAGGHRGGRARCPPARARPDRRAGGSDPLVRLSGARSWRGAAVPASRWAARAASATIVSVGL